MPGLGDKLPMKIANWNIEWMNRWFTADLDAAAFRPSADISGVTDIDDLCRRVANVIDGLDADVLTVQEGPSRKEEMALFVQRFLDGTYTVLGPTGKGSQKLFTLIRNGGAAAGATVVAPADPVKLTEPWEVDIDGNQVLQDYEFTREPLVVDVTDAASARAIRIVNVHLKSKFVHGGDNLWRDNRAEFVREALLARRRISAEASRLRTYLDALLEVDGKRAIVVCGDFNDGPGADFFERFYLTHNLVAAVAGSPLNPPKMFRHGFVDRVDEDDNYTAVFDDFIADVSNRRILLDHILVSPGLYWDITDGTVEHTVFDEQTKPSAAGNRERMPSDHRPQSIAF